MNIILKLFFVLILFTPLSSDKIKSLNSIIPDFQVNENYAISKTFQHSSSITADDSGNFIITWVDSRNNWNQDIYAQRYASDGAALDSNFKVNDNLGNESQGFPAVSTDNSGNFVITWIDSRNGGGDIYAQRYASDGTALGSNFKVNDDQGSVSMWFNLSISVDGDGNFIITWADKGVLGLEDIYAQRYAGDGTARGSNFKVNDDQGNATQNEPSISADSIGNFIITWVDERNSNKDIYAQRYASAGAALGSNFKVNDDTSSTYQGNPSVSADDSWNFIITWVDECNGNKDIYAQRYAGDGAALGSNFQVNDDKSSAIQYVSSIAADDSGNFVITWIDSRNGGGDVYAQRYASDGNGLGGNFQVNNNQGIVSIFWSPSISISVDGHENFIITWSEKGGLGLEDIYAQRFARDGTALGSNFQVNDDLYDASQYKPSISVDDSKNFIIAWQDERNYNKDIYAQRYASDGTALDSNFRVNDDLGSERQGFPAISNDKIGNFIITWGDERNGNSDIYAQRYARDGTGLGSNFKVNDDQSSAIQYGSAIAADDSGNFIITWEDERNGNFNIYAQRYARDGTALGSNFKVNDDLGSAIQFGSSIAADDSGNFVITWTDRRSGPPDIYAKRYSSDGTALGSNFKVNDDIGAAWPWQLNSSISLDGNGNFIISWTDSRKGSYIYAQRYSKDGTALGSNFKVNDQGTVWNTCSSISADDNGNFIIIWDDIRNGDHDIFAQRFSSDGTAIDSNFRINTTAEIEQTAPDVVLRNDRIYSTWEDHYADGIEFDIWANVLAWKVVGIVDDGSSQIPVAIVLYQNYPNPFNPSTTIEFALPKSEFIELKVYNILGKEVLTLVSNNLHAGVHQYQFDGKILASGVYYYQLVAGDYHKVKKMILLK